MTCLIISGGQFCELPAGIEYDYVIACDHGYNHAKQLNITPDLIIGDFDSYIGTIDEATDISIEKHPVMKDDSDTMLAIKHALSKGYNNIIIICAMGGRFDHSYANIQSMAYVANHGGTCTLYADKDIMQVLSGPNTISINKKTSYSLSLFSVTDTCTDLCISGSSYDVKNVELTNTFPLGLSNHIEAESAQISIGSGILLIVQSFIPDK